jgi:hypothetical protein
MARPRGRPKKTVTTFQKAQPKKRRGRPKGSKNVVTLERQRNEFLEERNAYLEAHKGEKPESELLKDFQRECECDLNPYVVLATGGGIENKYEMRRCMACGSVTRV